MQIIDRVTMNSRLVSLFVLLFAIVGDQLAKYLAQFFLTGSKSYEFWNGVVQFSLIHNPGGFLGIVAEFPPTMRFFFLNICVGVLLTLCIFYIFFYGKRENRFRIPLVWVTAGGLSNLLDRLIHDAGVVDFVSIGFGPVRTGIFNLADVYILGGSFILGYLLLES